MTDQYDRSLLKGFFAAYFHQDWRLDDKTTGSVVSRYIAENPDRAKLSSLATEIRRFVTTVADNEHESRLVRELGSEYMPSGDQISVRDWLLQVAKRLDDGR
jgi:hypothetical protein